MWIQGSLGSGVRFGAWPSDLSTFTENRSLPPERDGLEPRIEKDEAELAAIRREQDGQVVRVEAGRAGQDRQREARLFGPGVTLAGGAIEATTFGFPAACNEPGVGAGMVWSEYSSVGRRAVRVERGGVDRGGPGDQDEAATAQ